MPLAKIKELQDVSLAGIYAISHMKPKKGKIDFKVGRTIDFRKRLNGYHLCYNEGFYIYAVLPLQKHKYPLVDKHERKVALSKTVELEKRAHELLQKFNFTTSTRRKSEWFKATSAHIEKVFQQVHAEFHYHTIAPITQWSDPYIHVFDVDGFEEDFAKKHTSEKPPPELPQEGRKTRSGRVIKSTKNTKFKDMVYII